MLADFESVAPKSLIETAAPLETSGSVTNVGFVALHLYVVARSAKRLHTESHLPPRRYTKSHRHIVERGIAGLFGNGRCAESRGREVETGIEEDSQLVDFGIRGWVLRIDDAAAEHSVGHAAHAFQPHVHRTVVHLTEAKQRIR